MSYNRGPSGPGGGGGWQQRPQYNDRGEQGYDRPDQGYNREPSRDFASPSREPRGPPTDYDAPPRGGYDRDQRGSYNRDERDHRRDQPPQSHRGGFGQRDIPPPSAYSRESALSPDPSSAAGNGGRNHGIGYPPRGRDDSTSLAGTARASAYPPSSHEHGESFYSSDASQRAPSTVSGNPRQSSYQPSASERDDNYYDSTVPSAAATERDSHTPVQREREAMSPNPRGREAAYSPHYEREGPAPRDRADAYSPMRETPRPPAAFSPVPATRDLPPQRQGSANPNPQQREQAFQSFSPAPSSGPRDGSFQAVGSDGRSSRVSYQRDGEQSHTPQPEHNSAATVSSGMDISHPPTSSTPATSAGLSDPINLAHKLEALQLTSFYVRPGYAEVGRPINILSNYFAVRPKGGRGKIIYHYDIDINPVVKLTDQKKPRTLLRSVWEQLILDYESNTNEPDWNVALGASAFDGRKNCFTPIKFPIGNETRILTTSLNQNKSITRTSNREGSDDEYHRFRISFKLVAEVDLEAVMEFCRADRRRPTPHAEESCLTGLMATNVLLRDVPSKKYAQVGATGNKFYTIEGAQPLPQGAVVCKGFLQSFRYSNSGLPLLNLDLGFSAFLQSGPALHVVAQILGSGAGGMRGGPAPPSLDQLDERQISILKKKLRGARFTVTHRESPRLHTVISVTLQSAADLYFVIEGNEDKQSRRISVAAYYGEYYGCVVTKPRLPCIQYGKRAYIPLEFVRFADFNSLPPTNLTAEQTAAMIKVSAMRPDLRAKTINSWREELAYEKQPKIDAWGLQVNSKMVEIQARVLNPPAINYRGRVARPRDGSWNLRGQQFIRNANRPLRNWAVVSFDRYCDIADMQRYISYLCTRLSALGVSIENPKPPCIAPTDPRNPHNLLTALQQAARAAFQVSKEMPQLIVVILPGKDAWLYETIKKLSFTELNAPVPTQCMQAAKIKNPRGIDAYTDNLAMKVVSKLGGLAHQVPISELPGMVKGKTMILGADLGHPPFRPNSEEPTVACSIATYNADCDAYSAQIRLQEGRSEIIVDLSTMVEEHLRIFAKHNDGEYPERILIFRDGVSEGQYAAALQYEHDAVVKACARIQQGYRPRILVCVCAKRHNTRFFSQQPSDTDRTGNLPAGLVVDRTITHPYAFDFFLQAHAGLVGTARPTHYICLLDELATTPDQLQRLVNGLCFSFARCTRSVSLVPVCYMADLVCQKARLIVQRGEMSITPSETSGGRSGARPPPPPSTSGRSEATSSRFAERVDIHQIQKLMSKNPEMSQVAWWM